MSSEDSIDNLKQEKSADYALGVALNLVVTFLTDTPLDKDPQTFSELMAFFEKRDSERGYGKQAGLPSNFRDFKRPSFPPNYVQYRKRIFEHVENVVEPLLRAQDRIKRELKAAYGAYQQVKDDPHIPENVKTQKKEEYGSINTRYLTNNEAFKYVTYSADEWYIYKGEKKNRKKIKRETPPVPDEPEIPEGFELKHRPRKPFNYALKGGKRPPPNAEDVSCLLDLCKKSAARFLKAPPDHIHQNLVRLADMFDWDEDYGRILGFLWTYENVKDFRSLIDKMNQGHNPEHRLRIFNILISRFTGVDYETICAAFRETSPIMEGGVIITEERKDDESKKTFEWPVLSPRFLKDLDEPGLTLERLQQRYVGEQKPPENSFPSLEKIEQHVPGARYLSALIRGIIGGQGRRHVALYSEPGFGKTFFVDAMAALHGFSVIRLGEDRNKKDGQKSGLTPKERMDDILIGRLLFKNANVLLFVDDADGILDYADKVAEQTNHTISKVLILRVLEEDGMLWALNHSSSIPNALKSRFIAGYPYPPLNRTSRIAMLFEKAAAYGFDPEKDQRLARTLTRLAETFNFSNRDIENLCRTVKLVMSSEPGIDVSTAFEKAATHNIPFVYGHAGNALSEDERPEDFHPELLCASISSEDYDKREKRANPQKLIEKMTAIVRHAPDVATAGEKPVRILTYGPSETGKEALWRHIAAESNGNIDFVEMSLLNMLLDPQEAIGKAMEKSKGKNTIYFWRGAEILEHPSLVQNEGLKDLIRTNMDRVASLLPGTHVFSAHSVQHHSPEKNERGKLPWFLNLFHLRLQHTYMDEKTFEAAWKRFVGGKPKKFKVFPQGISAGSFLRFVGQQNVLSRIPGLGKTAETTDPAQMLISPGNGHKPDDEALKSLMDTLPDGGPGTEKPRLH